jgi:hypothetical protein
MISDTEFPIGSIIEKLNSGAISPEEAARQITALRGEDPSPEPIRMPPEAFFSELPDEERQKAREVFRALLSWHDA